jgi:sugar (pentulose or hexulose) kinase
MAPFPEANTAGAQAPVRRPPAAGARDGREARSPMHRNTQLLWIAEAEARRFQETALTQRAASEPQISVVSAIRGSARRDRWRRLIAQLSPAVAPAHPADAKPAAADAAPARAASGGEPADQPVSARSVIADLIPTSFDGQRG